MRQAMLAADLFELSPAARYQMMRLPDGIPILIIDNFYARPAEVRRQALKLRFDPPPSPYPGRIAKIPDGEIPSLRSLLRRCRALLNGRYLPAFPPDRRLAPLTRVMSDFAIVDLHPDELAPIQRQPHVDKAPVFGLVYLNVEERGGTLFFRPTEAVVPPPSAGYVTGNRDGFEITGRVKSVFNRLAVYPGSVHHSGDISGDWIQSEDRFTQPRLTQRLIFR
jgi:hypothetical protein